MTLTLLFDLDHEELLSGRRRSFYRCCFLIDCATQRWGWMVDESWAAAAYVNSYCKSAQPVCFLKPGWKKNSKERADRIFELERRQQTAGKPRAKRCREPRRCWRVLVAAALQDFIPSPTSKRFIPSSLQTKRRSHQIWVSLDNLAIERFSNIFLWLGVGLTFPAASLLKSQLIKQTTNTFVVYTHVKWAEIGTFVLISQLLKGIS